jgi:hypothetical protein
MRMREKPGQAKIRNGLSIIDRLLMTLLVLLASIYIFYGIASSRLDAQGSRYLALKLTHTPALVSPTANAAMPSPSLTPQVPQIEPGDWPGYLLGNGSYNAGEVRITNTTVSAILALRPRSLALPLMERRVRWWVQ